MSPPSSAPEVLRRPMVNMRVARPHFMSEVPRPRILVSVTVPQNGSKFQPLRSPAGTTSTWPFRTTRKPFSLPILARRTGYSGLGSSISEPMPLAASQSATNFMAGSWSSMGLWFLIWMSLEHKSRSSALLSRTIWWSCCFVIPMSVSFEDLKRGAGHNLRRGCDPQFYWLLEARACSLTRTGSKRPGDGRRGP